MAAVALVALSAAPAAAADQVDRTIGDSRITESSGLAASLTNPGVVWTQNDSGNPPQLFAITRSGRTAATLRVRAENRDWEAITSFELGGTPYLGVGDIGDNLDAHPSVRILLLPEPRRLSSATVPAQRTLELTYPGGPRDAEALLAEPGTGHLYVVSKELLGATVYEVPDAAWPGRRGGTGPKVELRKVASTSASLITDGTFLPDGRMLLRGYGRLSLLPRPEDAENGRLPVLASQSLPSQEQGESLTDVAGQLLVGSEGEDQPVLRVPVPGTTAAGGRPLPTATAPEPGTTPASPAASPAPSPAPSASGDDVDPAVIAGVGLGAAALVCVAVFILYPRRPRRR